MNLEKDFYFKVLKWASERKTFTLLELKEGLNLNDEEYVIVNHNKHDIFLHIGNVTSLGETIEQRKYAMSMESKFKLLELEELLHAKNSSRNALFIAILAIAFSIGSTLFSIYVVYNVVGDVNIVNPEIKNLGLIESVDNTVDDNNLQLQEITRLLEQQESDDNAKK